MALLLSRPHEVWIASTGLLAGCAMILCGDAWCVLCCMPAKSSCGHCTPCFCRLSAEFSLGVGVPTVRAIGGRQEGLATKVPVMERLSPVWSSFKLTMKGLMPFRPHRRRRSSGRTMLRSRRRERSASAAVSGVYGLVSILGIGRTYSVARCFCRGLAGNPFACMLWAAWWANAHSRRPLQRRACPR